MKKEIIDFRKNKPSDEEIVIIPCDVRITNRSVEIKKIGDNFLISIGCQHLKISKKNINSFIYNESASKKIKEIFKICEKGRELRENSPLLLKEYDDIYISSAKRVYSKDKYELRGVNIYEYTTHIVKTPDSFGDWYKKRWPYIYLVDPAKNITRGNAYEFTGEDFENINHVISVISEYYKSH